MYPPCFLKGPDFRAIYSDSSFLMVKGILVSGRKVGPVLDSAVY